MLYYLPAVIVVGTILAIAGFILVTMVEVLRDKLKKSKREFFKHLGLYIWIISFMVSLLMLARL